MIGNLVIIVIRIGSCNHGTARPQAKLLAQRLAKQATGVLIARTKRALTSAATGKAAAGVLNVLA